MEKPLVNQPKLISDGQKFGQWTVQYFVPNQYRKSWFCKCQCGSERIVRESFLLGGKSKSCGCNRKVTFTKSQLTHGLRNTNLYSVWNSIKNRCRNINSKAYKNYGARGIKISDEWLDFKNFYDWCKKNGYEKGLEIDRIDNDGNYDPSNCRFVNAKVNANNRRTNHLVTIGGETHTLSKWSELSGVNRATLRSRIIKGLKETDIIQPLLRRGVNDHE